METAGISVLLPVAIVAITESQNVAPDSLQEAPGETRCRSAGTLQSRALRDAELGDVTAVKRLRVCLRCSFRRCCWALGPRLHKGPPVDCQRRVLGPVLCPRPSLEERAPTLHAERVRRRTRRWLLLRHVWAWRQTPAAVGAARGYPGPEVLLVTDLMEEFGSLFLRIGCKR